MDKWDRKTNFNCESCMFYVPKRDAAIGGVVFDTSEGCCRRNAPTMKGYPVVYSSDWCGEHKIGSNPVRDGKKLRFCPKHAHIVDPNCVHCQDFAKSQIEASTPLTKEDDREVLDDEPMKGLAYDQPLVKTDALIAAEKELAEEKAKIKSEISGQLTLINNFADFGPGFNRDKITDSLQNISELLEKL